MWDIGPLDTVLMHVQNTVNYQLNGSLADVQWASLIPDGGGIVHLGEGRYPFMLSIYHQLRCLDLIRQAYTEGASDTSLPVSPTAVHCLNYLRMSTARLLCKMILRSD